jgi:FdrA protein
MLKDSGKPCVACLLGVKDDTHQEGNVSHTYTLEECAVTAAGLINPDIPKWAEYSPIQNQKLAELASSLKTKLNPQQRFMRGLFSGGTLCYEAQVIWRDILNVPVFSNAPLDKACLMDAKDTNRKHIALDLGEEEYTLGRPHPMIDNELRTRMIRMESVDPLVAVILLDVVLGYGAHPDPAAELGAAILQARKSAAGENREIIFIASVTGTEDDPQSLSETTEKLEGAGVTVCETNAQAARLAGLIISA